MQPVKVPLPFDDLGLRLCKNEASKNEQTKRVHARIWINDDGGNGGQEGSPATGAMDKDCPAERGCMGLEFDAFQGQAGRK